MITSNGSARVMLIVKSDRPSRGEKRPRARTRATASLLVGAAAAMVASVACSEPQPKCNVQLGSFAAVYTQVSAAGGAAAPTPCDNLPGDTLSVQGYTAAGASNYPDYDHATVAIQPGALTTASSAGTDPNAEDKPYGLGAFTTANPGNNGFCVAPTLSVAHVRTPAVTADPAACPPVAAAPAVDLEYAFANVNVLGTARNFGTQLYADLTVTDHVSNCTAQYKVAAVYPAVSCGAAAPTPDAGDAEDAATPAVDDASASDGGLADVSDDAQGATSDAAIPACDAGAPAPAPMIPDVTLCAATSEGNTLVSGLSPDYQYQCNPTLLVCTIVNPKLP